MKSKKWLAVAGITMSAALLLAACGKTEKKADAPTTFSYVYAIDPTTLDYSVTSKSSTSDVIANLVDGLLENDKYGNLIPSLAEDWSVSQDGLTYTYKLRKGVKWYTSEGEEVQRLPELGSLRILSFFLSLNHIIIFKNKLYDQS